MRCELHGVCLSCELPGVVLLFSLETYCCQLARRFSRHVLASTLCKYDLRKGDLFVLSWAMVRRVTRGSISSELIMCGEGCAVFCYCLLWLDA